LAPVADVEGQCSAFAAVLATVTHPRTSTGSSLFVGGAVGSRPLLVRCCFQPGSFSSAAATCVSPGRISLGAVYIVRHRSVRSLSWAPGRARATVAGLMLATLVPPPASGFGTVRVRSSRRPAVARLCPRPLRHTPSTFRTSTNGQATLLGVPAICVPYRDAWILLEGGSQTFSGSGRL